MIDRQLEKNLKKQLAQYPAVALLGPRQVGKTTLAYSLIDGQQSVYLDLENPTDLAKLEDVQLFHKNNRDKLIIIDEVQRRPELFEPLRGIIDSERRSGNKHGLFLFLGSASIDLLKQSSETLAGRIAYLELMPLSVVEMPNEVDRLWLRGGFPDSVLAESDAQSFDWRHNFISTYLERDIPQLGPRVPAATLRRFWTMLSHQQGSTLNAANLAKALGISGQTVARYLDLLVDLLLVRRLQPWVSNQGKRMVKSPKVYVRDSGLVHALLGIETCNQLLGHPVAGGSWEGFVIDNLHSMMTSRVTSYFYRSSGGAELDCVLEFTGGERWAIEIKKSLSPTVSKGFHSACSDVQVERKYVVYPGDESWELPHGVTVVSLPMILTSLADTLGVDLISMEC